jgi:ribulose kinase
MVPGLWLTEGGQSAAGSAITHLLAYHPSSASASRLATAASQSLPDWLVSQVMTICKTESESINIAGKVIIIPEFIGNRSPLADPDTRAIISGLSFENNLNSLLSFYIAGISGLGYGLRQIIDVQSAHGINTNSIVISGGAGNSPLVRQLLADSTGIPVAIPSSEEPILLGSAMLGAVSSGIFSSINESMQKMSQLGEILLPASGHLAALHQKRYSKFKLLQSASRDS